MPQYKLRMWDGQQERFGDGSTVLLSTADVVDYRAGDDPSTSPRKITGPVKYEDITLQRGLTQDSGFANWAAKVTATSSSGAEVSPANFHKNIYLEFFNEAGQLLVSYNLRWVDNRAFAAAGPAVPTGAVMGAGNRVTAWRFLKPRT